MHRSMPDINYFIAIGIGLLVLFGIMFAAQICLAGQINMNIIAQIESSNNPDAYNEVSGATGKYQITNICLADFNMYHNNKYTLKDMFNQGRCYEVAFWYLNKRIPQMLKHYGLKITIDNILICYNFGIGHLVNGDKLPKETRNYIKRYKERQ